MDGPQADEQSRGVGERLWYLPDTDQVRPAWRVVVPLVVGISLYLGISTAAWVPVGFEVQSPVDTTTSALLLGGQLAGGVGAAVAVVGLAARLDDQPISTDELVPSTP